MISVIIPTYNEETFIGWLVHYLQTYGGDYIAEIIVSDGGSRDETILLAEKAGAIAITSPLKSRAAQMNFAASKATGNILYFIHADCIPPVTFATDIIYAVKAGYGVGRYRTKFISNAFLLKVNAFFTRFDLFICYGGDQTLFLTSKLFTQLKGFDVSKVIMEDYDITSRAKEQSPYKIFSKAVLVSARKYKLGGWLQVQLANFTAVRSYKKGLPSEQIASTYRKTLHL
ncbi:MAG: TIGR04283 family arsenosugar biosynthesis glycosyltransferase [Ferruginibacter sp.]